MKYWCRVLNRFASNTVYVGLSYYGPAMGNDEYLSFFLSGLVEIPGYLFCWAVMDRWGRRWPLCMLMVVGGLFCVATVLMPEGSRCPPNHYLWNWKLKIEKKKSLFHRTADAINGTLVLYLIAKCAASGSFLILYPFAAEVYPTEVRGIGIGFTAYLGGLGLAVIPFINYLVSAVWTHLLAEFAGRIPTKPFSKPTNPIYNPLLNQTNHHRINN